VLANNKPFISDALTEKSLWCLGYVGNGFVLFVGQRKTGEFFVHGQSMGARVDSSFSTIVQAKRYAKNVMQHGIVDLRRTRKTLIGLRKVLFARGTSKLLTAGEAA
jgi:hypothetical protein